MQVVDNLIALRTRIKNWHQHNELVAFVPTMGNLHDGHLSLIHTARERADHVVVSIFVNPLQFNDQQDLDNYPRTLTEDINLLSEEGCDLVFTPAEDIMYPFGMSRQTQVHVPEMDDRLCGKGRPGHFDGVATVITKLFNMVQADIAIFGEKDYQQLILVRKLVQDLNLPIDIVGAPTRREDSGLALSSRNHLLNQKELMQAPALYQQLHGMKEAIEQGELNYTRLIHTAHDALKLAGLEPEYIDISRAEDLEKAIPGEDKHLRILMAAQLGNVRLIDNIACNLA